MKKLAVAIALAALLPFAGRAEERATTKDAERMVHKAVEYVKKEGRERAFAVFSDPTGPFTYRDLYVTAFETGAMDVLDRNLRSGIVTQKPGEAGCFAAATVGDCNLGRATGLTGSVVVSPDGRNVYSTSQKSAAVDVFRRIK